MGLVSAGMRFTFAVAGDTLIDRELLRVGTRAKDARPAFAAIGGLLMAETKVQFDTEGRHASGGWAPLQPATVAAKRRHGFRPQILQETGALLDSLTVKGDPNQILRITRNGLTFGSKLPYAESHQNPRAGSPLPQRRPLEFTDQTKRAVVRVLQGYLFDGRLPA